MKKPWKKLEPLFSPKKLRDKVAPRDLFEIGEKWNEKAMKKWKFHFVEKKPIFFWD